MADRQAGIRRSKAQILQDIDSKLPTLPRDQQNLVAAYAHGVRTGLALQAALEAERPPAPMPPPLRKR